MDSFEKHKQEMREQESREWRLTFVICAVISIPVIILLTVFGN